MRNLLNFLIRYSTWFVFTFFVLLSLILLFQGNSYHSSVYLTSSNEVTSTINGLTSGLTGYFNLKTVNESLLADNATLRNRILNMQNELNHYKVLSQDSLRFKDVSQRFSYVTAAVINNSTRHPRNYFTINRGTADGVRTGMGVVDHNGIVGIVNVAGPHTARVMSVLTQQQYFSVKLKNTPFVGSLTWRGIDPHTAYVEEVARHTRYRIGDTIVTSGYSTTFPEGIPVGTIVAQIKSADDNFFTLKIRLLPDFSRLETVNVIKDSFKAELDSLSTFDRTDE